MDTQRREPEPVSALTAGQAVGSYVVVKPLGQGGMANVYLARERDGQGLVAIKVINLAQLPSQQAPQFTRRFALEAREMARLQHPHIVRVIDSGYLDSTPYLVLEYVPGGTLRERVSTPWPWAEAVGLIIPVAQALDYAHQQGLIHRDVKPANILLRRDGSPVLSDFGIAKTVATPETTLGATLTTTGALLGTPEYMAPEQVKGSTYDNRVDIYALAVVLFELITGRHLFKADTPWEVLTQHLRAPVPNASSLVRGLPLSADRILKKALAKRPEDRYASMAEFVVALEASLARPMVPWRWIALGGLGVAVVVGGVAGALSLAAYASGQGASPTRTTVPTWTVIATRVPPTMAASATLVPPTLASTTVAPTASPTASPTNTEFPTTQAPTVVPPTRRPTVAPPPIATLPPPTSPPQQQPTEAPNPTIMPSAAPTILTPEVTIPPLPTTEATIPPLPP